MRILIEYYKFSTIIEGKAADREELEEMFRRAIKLRKGNYDGFAELFCSLFDFKIIKVFKEPAINEKFSYTLDIDTDLILPILRP